MEFSEFMRLLGSDPHNRDPAFLAARSATPKHRAAAAESDHFEHCLTRALAAELPADLAERLRAIPATAITANVGSSARRRWSSLALAASLVLAIGATGLIWRMNTGWDSVQAYVVEHYHHDGEVLLSRAGPAAGPRLPRLLAEFGVEAAPELAGSVTVVKNCPTPDGKGVHMVLNTDRGLITLLYMPATAVADGERLAFDGLEAILVALDSGSAAIVGTGSQHVDELHAFVQRSIHRVAGKT